MTVTLELSDLRSANEEALAQLNHGPAETFDERLAEIESFLLSLYRIAVLAVRSEHEMGRAAQIWRETLDVIDSSTRQVQAVAGRERGNLAALDRILEIRSAASDMLSLYA